MGVWHECFKVGYMRWRHIFWAISLVGKREPALAHFFLKEGPCPRTFHNWRGLGLGEYENTTYSLSRIELCECGGNCEGANEKFLIMKNYIFVNFTCRTSERLILILLHRECMLFIFEIFAELQNGRNKTTCNVIFPHSKEGDGSVAGLSFSVWFFGVLITSPVQKLTR